MGPIHSRRRLTRLLVPAAAIVLLALLAQWRHASLPGQAPPAELGQIIEGAGRANFDGFKRPGVKFGVAFKAAKSGEITQVALPWRYTKNRSARDSYGWGNYGVYTIELQANGPDHLPSGTVLAAVTNIQPAALMRTKQQQARDDYPLVVPLKARLTAGTVYHLVVTNLDPHPGENWSSANTVMTRVLPWEEWIATGVGARALACQDGRWTPWTSRSNPWNTTGGNAANGSHVPLIVTWADGSTSGDPYWSAAMTDPLSFWGAFRAGQFFVWEHPSTEIVSLGLSVKKIGNPAGALYYHLEEVNGPAVASGVLATPAQAPAGNAAAWVHARLEKPFTLKHRREYRLWFASPQSTGTENCYLHHPVYGPGDDGTQWGDTGWGGSKGCLVYEKEGQWVTAPTHDLSFSLRTERQ